MNNRRTTISLRLALTLLLLAFISMRASAAKPKLPSEKELKALALESLLAFNHAVQEKDFTAFHAHVSQLWQGQITPAKLRESFQTFIDQQIDITFISESDPVFEPAPKIDSDGVLVLQGHYPTTPNRVDFRLKYVSEKNAWKLFGIKLNVLPAGPGDAKLPDETEIRALVLDSLGKFNRAVQEKDFTSFYGEIAALWQKQTTPKKLQSLFQSFIDKEIDLAPVLKLEPRFEPAPALNDDGLLEVKGFFRTKPDVVQFDLAYLFEPPAWKLVKINVKVGSAEEEEAKDE